MYGRDGPRGQPRYYGGRGGGRPQWSSVPREAQRRAPDGLIMLAASGENIIPWTNTLAGSCEMKYGTTARFPGIDAKVVTKMLVENLTTVMKQENKDKEASCLKCLH